MWLKLMNRCLIPVKSLAYVSCVGIFSGRKEVRYGGNGYTSRSRYAGGGVSASSCGSLITLPWTWERNVVLEGIAPLGTLDLQHAITQLVKALADPARAFAFVQHVTEVRPLNSACWMLERHSGACG